MKKIILLILNFLVVGNCLGCRPIDDKQISIPAGLSQLQIQRYELNYKLQKERIIQNCKSQGGNWEIKWQENPIDKYCPNGEYKCLDSNKNLKEIILTPQEKNQIETQVLENFPLTQEETEKSNQVNKNNIIKTFLSIIVGSLILTFIIFLIYKFFQLKNIKS